MDWPDLRDRIAECNRLAAEHRATSGALEAPLASRPAAIENERAAYAEAIRAGKADPGESNLSRLNTRTAAANRKAEALAVAAPGA